MLDILDTDFFGSDPDEGIMARDVNGQLIRVEPAQRDDYDRKVVLTIDGRSVTVPLAVPLTDAQGNIVRDKEGKTTPRFTSIYDAAREATRQHAGYQNEIPILCHQEHLPPVAVCRICMVEVRGKERRENGLVPACQFRVKDGLDVHTLQSTDADAVRRISGTVKVLAELLAADHLSSGPVDSSPVAAQEDPNELRVLARKFLPQGSRFASRTIERGMDGSSAVIAVNHESCVLCDRCVRACTEVKHNNVIGRTGKGYFTHIGFDLNDPMGNSSCVSCGECMISCPTDALTFRSQIESKPPESSRAAIHAPDIEPVLADDLRREHLLFRSLPYKFLMWNSGSVWRRRVRAGDVLCEEGEYGNTAFILLRGKFGVYVGAPQGEVVTEKASGWLGWFNLLNVRIKPLPAAAGAADSAETARTSRFGRLVATHTAEDLILGEMTCMNNYPRSATLVAMEDAEVFEIRRNVLYLMQRNPASRAILNETYRNRALERELNSIGLLAALPEEVRKQCVALLKPHAELLHLDPGQIIFRQGEPADHFYMVRLGYVKVSQRFERGEWVLDYLGPRRHFGEIGLLSRLQDTFQEHIPISLEGRRTATCTALDHVELIRIRGEDFHAVLAQVPELKEQLRQVAMKRLSENADRQKLLDQPLDSFLEQGLFLGQSLLVLDLESCTRCDECTKACADTHQGVTRLIREGLRFDKFLVASSCRSCIDPYCLVGCPVDAIHRRDTLQIRIEDHCIGCGLCAQNCPYGNINMHGFPGMVTDVSQPGGSRAVVHQKATTCDLCSHITKDHREAPSCVFACPHDAAFRMTGPELKKVVTEHRERR